MATKPNTKELRVTLPATTRDKLDTIAADAWRKVPDMVAYLIETYNPAAVNPVNLKDAQALSTAQAEESKRPVGRPPARPAVSNRIKHPITDVVFIKDEQYIAGASQEDICTSGWLVKTPIGEGGDIFWVNAYPVCEKDPDHPCGFKPPHAFALDESHMPFVWSQVTNLGTPNGNPPLVTPEAPAAAYFEGYIEGQGFDTEVEALAWVWDQMVAGKGPEMWLKCGPRT